MKHQSITPVITFEDPNTPDHFECLLKKVLIEHLFASYRQSWLSGDATP